MPSKSILYKYKYCVDSINTEKLVKLFWQNFCFGVLLLNDYTQIKAAEEFSFFVRRFWVKKIVTSLIKSVFTQIETEIVALEIFTY